MSHETFATTSHCRSGLHCRSCRDLAGGRAWRQSVARLYMVPEIDWPCPEGLAWGFASRGPERPAPEDGCRRCPRDDCLLKPLSDCRRRKRLAAGFRCPNAA